MSNKKNKQILVSISTLAIASAPNIHAYAATANFQCVQHIYLGKLVADGTCGGTYTIKPTGSTVNKGGCLIVITKAIPGTCDLTVQKLTKSQSVTVAFTAASFLATGPSTVTIKNLVLNATGKSASVLTFTKKDFQKTPTLIFGVGGSLVYSAGQTIGKYVGKVSITANIN
jgi:hypothetical protein